jgi:4-hydroxybutyrate CoA-transferase
MDWQEIYRQKLTTPAEAVKVVKSGDTVMVPIFPPATLSPALAARRGELSDVTIRLLAPTGDPGWLRLPDDSAFRLEFELYIGDYARYVTDERRGAYLPNLFSLGMKAYDHPRGEARVPDVMFCTVSRPNRAGYVHFGLHQWNQHAYAKRCPVIIAEVNDRLPAVHGDVWLHVSDVDMFVEHTPATFGRAEFDAALAGIADPARRADWEELGNEVPNLQILGSLQALIPVIAADDVRRLLGLAEPPPEAEAIARYLREFVHDGDTIQIGVGEPARGMVRMGAFEGRRHLGIHTELGWPGLAAMWRDGIVDGSAKEIHAGKSTATAWTGCDPTDYEIIEGNPHFELYDPDYLLHPSTLMKFDRFIAINNAITVDLVGQINSETVFGGRIINGTGGQPDMHLGGVLSPNGRAITLLPSTAMGGAVSRVVAQMEAGSYVTIPRFYADTIITEFGVARLWGKNHRQRAEEMINVAHPDHRDDLRAQARALWWP